GPLHGVAELVGLAAQTPHLVLELLHALEQGRGQFAAAGRGGSATAWWRQRSDRAAAASRSERLHLAPQFQDLVLQRDPLAALDLRRRRQRQQNHSEGCDPVPHAIPLIARAGM